MTIASRLLQRAERTLTPQQVWGSDSDFWPKRSAAGVAVSAETALGLPAYYMGLRQLAADIASCPWDVIEPRGDERIEVERPPWMVQPTTNPNDTWQDYIADLVVSLSTDGNLFVLAVPNVFDAQMLFVQDPNKCAIVRHRGAAIAYFIDGLELGADQVIHSPLIRTPGKVRGIGPIEAGQDSIGEGLAAQEFSARYFSNGALLDVMIEVPGSMDDDDINRLVDSMKRKHTGVRKSHAIGALTGGAKISRIGSNAQEAQLLDLRRHNVQDQARLLAIPSFMVNDVTPGAVSYASSEVSDRRYLRSGVAPIVTRIESSHKRLLPHERQLKANLAGLLRGDRKARWETYQIGINSKVLTVDEVRAWEDLPPADKAAGVDTDNGGFVETPNNNAPGASPETKPDAAPPTEVSDDQDV